MNPDYILTDPMWLAFQATLDEHPDSSGTRLVLADYLEECSHPWAAAMRWLGTEGKWPDLMTGNSSFLDWWEEGHFWDGASPRKGPPKSSWIPTRIFKAIKGYSHPMSDILQFRSFPTRVAAEIAFCRAWIAVERDEELTAVRAELAEILKRRPTQEVRYKLAVLQLRERELLAEVGAGQWKSHDGNAGIGATGFGLEPVCALDSSGYLIMGVELPKSIAGTIQSPMAEKRKE